MNSSHTVVHGPHSGRRPAVSTRKIESTRDTDQERCGIYRILAGLVLIGWGLYTQSGWGAVGLVPLVIGLVGWCPTYLPLKPNTIKSA